MQLQPLVAKTGASFARGHSKQDYETPMDFIAAIKNRFGPIAVDLAATEENAKAPVWIDEERDAFTVDWHRLNGLLFLNPPFDNLAPWAERCRHEMELGARILFLTPASIGSNWFAAYVHNKALVLALNPRLCFDGKNPYPKDTILSCYGEEPGFDVWRWKE